MSQDVLARTCLTTNFDKLLERAFDAFGITECQAIRMPEEVEFLREEPDRCYCLKLHGDYDTHNILNTDTETVSIDERLAERARQTLSHRGLLVLGLAGFEKSIHTFIDSFNKERAKAAGVCEHGLLWGVYVGSSRPKRLSQAGAERLVKEAIDNGAVGTDVLRFMQEGGKSKVPHAFFPLWGAGSFLWELMNRHGDTEICHAAEPYLDHEQRVREVFRKKALSSQAQDEHIERLRQAQRILAAAKGRDSDFEWGFSMESRDSGGTISLVYGNIADVGLLSTDRVPHGISAVVSPEDTCLSVGGGAALALAQAAGMRRILHEVSKFAPIPHGSSVVTSGGQLPVNYIVHAAGVEIEAGGPLASAETISSATADMLSKCAALSVTRIFVPLLAAGVAGLTAEESLSSISEALAEQNTVTKSMNLILVVYREAILGRSAAQAALVDAYRQRGITLI